MTDNEIIKALECCNFGYECDYCPDNNENWCVLDIKLQILDLINRQKAEIEKLKQENEFFRKTITQNAQRALEVTVEEIEKTKSEAIKEFAERLKDGLRGIGRSTIYGNFEYGTIKSYEIDNLVKELTEENKK